MTDSYLNPLGDALDDSGKYVIHRTAEGRVEYSVPALSSPEEVKAIIEAEYPDDLVFIIDGENILDNFFMDAWVCDDNQNLSYDITKVREVAIHYTRAHARQILDKLRLDELLGEAQVNTVAADFSTFKSDVANATTFDAIKTLLNNFHTAINWNWRQGDSLDIYPLDDNGNF